MIAYLRTLLLNLPVCLFLGSSVGLCQDMNSGFKMLENGEFGEARSFFEKVLADFPQNKTARLCHGRAVGLSGDPERAIKTFTTLLNEYPGDTEVRLNLAESYLWQKTPTQAIPVYTSLISEDPTQFGAVLGIANSYSMDLQYYKAYQYINKALELQPDNGQARLSAKFIRLGFANKLASQDHLYDSAFQLLEENLTIDPNDQESLALQANIYIISKDYALADATYQQMQDPITSLKGQSVALHLLEEDELALEKATEALELTKTSDEYAERSMEAGQHYVSALLWNSRLKDAGQFQDSLYRANQDPELIATQAEVAMYEGDFVKGIDRYNAYLEFKPRSFNGNLGKANAMHALGMDKSAYNMAFKSKVLFPGQLDVLNFIGNLNLAHSPRVSGEYLYGRASDESIVTGWTTSGSLSIDPLFNVSFSYGEKEFTPPTEGTVSTSETFAIDLKRQINKRLKLNTHYGAVRIVIPDSATSEFRSDVDIDVDIWISKSQKMNVGYQTEIQDFNAALINQNLKTQSIVVKNIMFWKNSNIGWYSELYRTYFSDGNNRNLLFTSLYRSIPSRPALKFGTNLLLMNFKESKPINYYSPLSFVKIEAFAGLEYKGKRAPVSVLADLAGGVQFVDGLTQGNWRTQVVISRNAGPFEIQLKGLYTTISETQAAGFSYTEFRGGIVWTLSKKPVFFKKISK